jgi:predicted GNAT family acetyltransferase
MDERHGESCTDLLADYGIEKCYAGWQDPTQHPVTDYPFNLQVTDDTDIFNSCRDIAASFLPGAMVEAFDQPYKTKSEKSEYGDVDMLAKLPDGTYLSIMFNREDDENDTWGVEFYRNNSQEVTGEGDAQRIFATVLAAIQKFIKKHKPQKLFFSASKEVEPGQNSESRAKLYDRLVQRYARAWGYRAFRADTGALVRYEFSNAKQVKEDASDIEVRSEPTPRGGVEVHAYRDGKELGWVRFVKLSDGKFKASMVFVPERLRRQGIGSAMYKHARHKLGLDIVPSDSQTSDGRAFWNKIHEVAA